MSLKHISGRSLYSVVMMYKNSIYNKICVDIELVCYGSGSSVITKGERSRSLGPRTAIGFRLARRRSCRRTLVHRRSRADQAPDKGRSRKPQSAGRTLTPRSAVLVRLPRAIVETEAMFVANGRSLLAISYSVESSRRAGADSVSVASTFAMSNPDNLNSRCTLRRSVGPSPSPTVITRSITMSPPGCGWDLQLHRLAFARVSLLQG